ncbi:hypothetical protein J6590_044496 [Homalodisca vitripennis]|nr:hypothetical protein J6590_044496 [Homalodisca vitripennis]
MKEDVMELSIRHNILPIVNILRETGKSQPTGHSHLLLLVGGGMEAKCNERALYDDMWTNKVRIYQQQVVPCSNHFRHLFQDDCNSRSGYCGNRVSYQ